MGGCLTNQEEVIERTSLIADQVAVDDSAASWVLDGDCSTIVLWCIRDILFEKSLVDSLVNHDQRDLRLFESTREFLFDDFIENMDFFRNDLVTHGVTNTIAEDDNVLHSALVLLVVLFAGV